MTDEPPIRCLGPCGRTLPAGSFRWNRTRHGKRIRRRHCKDCQAGRPVASIDDPAGLVRRYEAMRRGVVGRSVRCDDPGWTAIREEVRRAVVDVGPIAADGVRLGWDWRREEVSRAVVRM